MADRTLSCAECGLTFVQKVGRGRIRKFCPTCKPSPDWPPSPTEKRRLIAHLARRDGRDCELCRQPINLGLRHGKMRCSIDHVVPRSQGGTNDPANLRLVHLFCNCSRGNRGGGEQLALVG